MDHKDATIEEQRARLNKIAETIRGKLGKESLTTFEEGMWDPVEVISTGSVAIDAALGIGGFPKGRIIELYGPESGGKTSIVLSNIAQAQSQGLLCAFIDAENSFNPEWATLLGIDMTLLLLSQESCLENAFALIDNLIEQKVDVIALDSVAGLAPKAELEGNVGDWQIGLVARLMSQAMRRLSSKINLSNSSVIFINQIRQKIGVMFGNPETTPGGKALKFHASIRLEVRGSKHIKSSEGSDPIGMQIHANVVKNKVAPPFKRAIADFYFDRGFDNELAYIDWAIDKGVLAKKGAYYTFEEITKYRADWAIMIKEDAPLLKRLIHEVQNV